MSLVPAGDPQRPYLYVRNGIYYYKRKHVGSGRKGAVLHSLNTRVLEEAQENYDERHGSHAKPLPSGLRVKCRPAFDAWSLNPLGKRDQATVDKHKTTWDNWVGPVLDSVVVADVTPKLCIQVFDRARTVKSKKTGEYLSPAMLRQVYKTMSAFFNWCSQEPQVYRHDNPVARIGDYRPPQPAITRVENEQVLSRDELDAIVLKLAASKGDPVNIYKHQTIAQLSAAIGTRISETLALTLDAIDLEEGVVQINQQLRRQNQLNPDDPSTWFKTTKGAKGTIGDGKRAVMLNPFARRILESYLERGKREGWLNEQRNRWDLLFPNAVGKPMVPGHVGTKISTAAKDAGIERRIVSHFFRHTYASTLVMGGLTLEEVAEQLGHAPEMTRKRYAHIESTPERNARIAGAGWQ
jgi:site-specific recombinase XerD